MTLHLLALAALLQGTPEFRWHGVVPQGKTIEVRGVNGAVTASATTGREVEVTATKRSHRADPATVEIRVEESADGVLICAVYPSQHGGEGCNGQNHNRGTNNRDNDVEVTFTVKVPAGVRFQGRTVNGNVTATNLAADAEVSTVNGSVDVSTGGRAEASTVNGNVRARLGQLGSGDLQFTTVNGSVNVTVPANAALDVDASTVTGDISTDFDMTVNGRFGPRSMHGKVGGGGRKLSMSTVNGSIELRKGS